MGYLPVDVTPFLVDDKENGAETKYTLIETQDNRAGTLKDRVEAKSNEDCPICVDKLTSPRCRLTCGHTFHASCVEKWLRRVPSCPMCRISVPLTTLPVPETSVYL
jgi:hypothetical protein